PHSYPHLQNQHTFPTRRSSDLKLYKTLQSTYTFMSHWVPGSGTESLFTVINETNAGTLEDPIPYEGNMELFNGKYYIQNGIIYKDRKSTRLNSSHVSISYAVFC